MNIHLIRAALQLMAALSILWPIGASAQTFEQLLSHLSPCPDVHLVQRHALRAQRLLRSEDPRMRMRLSNAIPRLELELGWLHQDDEERRYREDLNRLDSGSMHRDFIRQDALNTRDSRRTIRLRLSVDLGKIVFDPRELQWIRHRRQQDIDRQRLIAHVTTLYWQRRQHQLQLLLSDKDDLEAMIRHHTQIQLLTAQLSGLTSGWFARQLRAKSATAKGPTKRSAP